MPRSLYRAAALAVLVAELLIFPSGVDASGLRQSHAVTVHHVLTGCQRGPVSTLQFPRGTVTVHGYYVRIVQFFGPGELGLLFDRAVAHDDATRDAAYRVKIVTIPGTSERTLRIRIGKGGLLVTGPTTEDSPPYPQNAIPDFSWVQLRGQLYCRNLAQTMPDFSNGAGKDFLNMRSWHVWHPPGSSGSGIGVEQ